MWFCHLLKVKGDKVITEETKNSIAALVLYCDPARDIAKAETLDSYGCGGVLRQCSTIKGCWGSPLAGAKVAEKIFLSRLPVDRGEGC